MRIQVDVDDNLFQKAILFSKLETKEEILESALRLFIEAKQQEILKHQQNELPKMKYHFNFPKKRSLKF